MDDQWFELNEDFIELLKTLGESAYFGNDSFERWVRIERCKTRVQDMLRRLSELA